MTDAAFWNNIAPRYAKSPVRDPAAYDRTIERTRAYLGDRDRVLEVGAGTGSTALRLSDAVGTYLATDISDKMIDIARAKPDLVGNIDFRTAVADADVSNGTPFDTIISFNYLHLASEIDVTLKALHGQLKKDGLLITKTLCLAEKGPWLRWIIRAMQWVGKAPYVSFMKIPELEARIEAAGFELVETKNYPDNPPNRFVVARKR
jgi:ubiquinone/menaquinone biosynthesis C-methylase UbiE